ncbi:hypothetical protein ACFY91_24330 [Streptomyces albogriseolus]|uniref:hypothetical protein n=1 Tax=Streptomyces albogriseolus TaxID=1887 RepID=UPI0036E6C41D
MDSSVLRHPRIAEAVETLVTARGGGITYDVGGGGRETLLAAGARLAAETNTPLTIVEARSLHSDVRAFVREVQPEARSAVISAEEAALQPDGSINGVLAVHADVLRDADVRQPLLAMAHSADHLLVARHDYSDTTLDALATPGLVLRLRDLMLSAPRPAPITLTPPPIPPMDTSVALGLVRKATRAVLPDEDLEVFDKMAEVLERVDPAEVRQRIGELRSKYEATIELARQRRAATGPTDPSRTPLDHGQEQAAAHQQHRSKGTGRT